MGNPFPWGLPCGARADAFRSRREGVSIPSLGVCAFCGFQKVAVSNHGAALTGTNNVPEAHGEPPRPKKAFEGQPSSSPSVVEAHDRQREEPAIATLGNHLEGVRASLPRRSDALFHSRCGCPSGVSGCRSALNGQRCSYRVSARCSERMLLRKISGGA